MYVHSDYLRGYGLMDVFTYTSCIYMSLNGAFTYGVNLDHLHVTAITLLQVIQWHLFIRSGILDFYLVIFSTL